ncbi:MAG: phenylalanyl-tRNA synthetase alpha chain [Parcubacteria group bacterium Gr01-1014_18]|nr:MAG: phenylalanyl-tRNA synthetase alpha chain [Parcubacteria group bacterium Greene0416_36]TSC80956.1 MAG: phenylalanyl-tRNA synthetase alpha chain [Parcubacteria group bacterium Gr01-1014_18]TSC98701.1 MAG: phenylalanyl-tRNA synthetase alpha chain [Parcubacteria group bacterium Greene1014_20]TSD06453.1 MAG: phenylalanyl-tRNA synthetase alpha chain [Parcubacteria group bacterium Greene0714_2]
MKDQLKKIHADGIEKISKITSSPSWDSAHLEFFGKKEGRLSGISKGLKDLSVEEKKELGSLVKSVWSELEDLLTRKKKELDNKIDWAAEKIDLTLPGKISGGQSLGALHPLTQIRQQIEDIFISMGFMVLDGPELESDYYNFEALNIPPLHPARDMQDTMWMEDGNLMRTQTSAIQVRALEKYGAPLRAIIPGRVFRYENVDACHEHTFYQIEGMMVGKNITIANLIAMMRELLGGVFKKDVKVRLRPGYFPFVEPGFEMDINCLICGGKGCSACKHSGWLEILPCGMIHPNVLSAGDVDTKEYGGFAFALGLDRLVMMLYGIEDIRHFHANDVRFLKQF